MWVRRSKCPLLLFKVDVEMCLLTGVFTCLRSLLTVSAVSRTVVQHLTCDLVTTILTCDLVTTVLACDLVTTVLTCDLVTTVLTCDLLTTVLTCDLLTTVLTWFKQNFIHSS